jgi:hypothetical protein
MNPISRQYLLLMELPANPRARETCFFLFDHGWKDGQAYCAWRTGNLKLSEEIGWAAGFTSRHSPHH